MAVATKDTKEGPAGTPGREVLRLASRIARRLVAEHVPEVSRSVPIQCSVDIAVPLEVVYEEWMKVDFLPEGAHRICEIERDGGRLTGRVAGKQGHAGRWEADILDERPNESFAWRSVSGSDCVGLITFHRLAERLTRLELELDVVPTGVGEGIELFVHLADRHAEADLRRFKADLERISPDEYSAIAEPEGGDAGEEEGGESDNDKEE
jgi:uncharacterized membrane protein